MNQAEKIRDALAKVESLRDSGRSSAELGQSVARLKHLQALRFRGTYADLTTDVRFAPATSFFLEELYGERDFASRDAQFFKVAGALERMLPGAAVDTAVTLARLHVLSEELDYHMAATSIDFSIFPKSARQASANYVHAWRKVGRREDRMRQLRMVLTLGQDLIRLTNTRGLRLILRMMHAPANAAGFGALQHFLEYGFDTFASMSKTGGHSAQFMSSIRDREIEMIDMLFDEEFPVCQQRLAQLFELVN